MQLSENPRLFAGLGQFHGSIFLSLLSGSRRASARDPPGLQRAAVRRRPAGQQTHLPHADGCGTRTSEGVPPGHVGLLAYNAHTHMTYRTDKGSRHPGKGGLSLAQG